MFALNACFGLSTKLPSKLSPVKHVNEIIIHFIFWNIIKWTWAVVCYKYEIYVEYRLSKIENTDLKKIQAITTLVLQRINL